MSGPRDFTEVLATGQLAPHVIERKSGGQLIAMFEGLKPPGQFEMPPTATLVITRNLGGGIRHHSDLGDGARSYHDPPGSSVLRAPHVGPQFDVLSGHHIRLFAWPIDWVAAALARAGGAEPPASLGLAYGVAMSSPRLQQLLDTLWAEADGGTATALLSAEGFSLSLLGELLRLSKQPLQPARGGLPPWAVRRCVDYVRAHLDRDVAIAELAGLVGLSTFHFARAFRASVGQTPGAYQREARMEQARALLADTALPVIEVAAAVGYETPQAFSRIFRRMTGVTPSRWRSEYRR